MATGGQTGGRPLCADVEAPSEVVEALAAIAAVLRAVLVVVGWTPPSNEVSFHPRPGTPTHSH